MFKIVSLILLLITMIFCFALTKGRKEKIDLWRGPTKLRGINILQSFVTIYDHGSKGTGPIGSPFTISDFKAMAALGANYINISHPGPFTQKPPFVTDERVLENLDTLLEMIQKADMFAVISLRTGPGRNEYTFVLDEDKTADPANGWFPAELYNDSVWTDPAARDAWAKMWMTLAKRYKNNPIIVGYDLMVEPNANEVFFRIYDPQTFYKKYSNTGYDWNSWYPNLVNAIRSVDTKTPILVQSMGHSHVDWMPFMRPSKDQKVVYAIHNYEPFSYTHQHNTKNHYPGQIDTNHDNKPEMVDRNYLAKGLIPFDNFLKTNKKLMGAVNEFGLHRDAPGAAFYVSDMMDLFEERGWNYALWVWYSSHFTKYRPAQETHFDPRFGTDISNTKAISNAFQDAVVKRWKRNTVRPSNTPF